MGQAAGSSEDCACCASREKPGNPLQEAALVRITPGNVSERENDELAAASEVQRLRRENEELAARCADAQGQAARLHRANQELKELQDSQTQVLMQKVQHVYEAVQVPLGRTEKPRQEEKAMHADMPSQVEALRSENSSLLAQIRSLTSENLRLAGVVSQLESDGEWSRIGVLEEHYREIEKARQSWPAAGDAEAEPARSALPGGEAVVLGATMLEEGSTPRSAPQLFAMSPVLQRRSADALAGTAAPPEEPAPRPRAAARGCAVGGGAPAEEDGQPDGAAAPPLPAGARRKSGGPGRLGSPGSRRPAGEAAGGA